MLFLVVSSLNRNVNKNVNKNDLETILNGFELEDGFIKADDISYIEEDDKTSIESVYEGEALADVFDRAVSKLSMKGYEILGTEQIIASILESENSQFIKTINENVEVKIHSIQKA